MSEIAIKNDGYPDITPGMKVKYRGGSVYQVVSQSFQPRLLSAGSVVMVDAPDAIPKTFRDYATEYSTDNGATWLPYRRAEPEPEYEPWTFATCPILRALRDKRMPTFLYYPLGVTLNGVRVMQGDSVTPSNVVSVPWDELARHWERLSNNEWQPCGKRK